MRRHSKTEFLHASPETLLVWDSHQGVCIFLSHYVLQSTKSLEDTCNYNSRTFHCTQACTCHCFLSFQVGCSKRQQKQQQARKHSSLAPSNSAHSAPLCTKPEVTYWISQEGQDITVSFLFSPSCFLQTERVHSVLCLDPGWGHGNLMERTRPDQFRYWWRCQWLLLNLCPQTSVIGLSRHKLIPGTTKTIHYNGKSNTHNTRAPCVISCTRETTETKPVPTAWTPVTHMTYDVLNRHTCGQRVPVCVYV